MAQKQLQRKERERLRHKEEILGYSLELFSKYGFNNVSMQQIAEASEFGVGTLYNFFKSKEALFEELINNTGQQILKEFLEILDGRGNEKERLLAFIRHQPKFLEKHGTILKLYFSEMGVKNIKLSKIRDKNKISKVLDSKLTEIFDQGIRKGIFRQVDPEIAAKTLSSIIETIIFEITEHCEKDEFKEKFQKVEQLFFEGLLLAKESHV